jgi:hypothetical protein
MPEEAALAPYYPDPAVCRRCWAFGRVCTPPLAEAGFSALVDATLELQLERRAALHEAAREYEALDKTVKTRVRGKDGLMVGRWLIRGKSQLRRYAAKPATERTIWLTTFDALEPSGPESSETP